jgi:hypothetical protein
VSEPVGLRVATVEIGKTRAKSVVVELARPPVLVTRPRVLDTADIGGRNSFRHVLGLFARLVGDAPEPLDGAALSLGGPIDYGAGSYDVVGPGLADPGTWPKDLSAVEAEIAAATGLAKVTVINDAVAFAYGVSWNVRPAEDTLCLTLGTGIGAATLMQRGEVGPPNSIVPLELHAFRRHWPCCFSGSPHELAGRSFFRYARDETEWDLEEIGVQFTQRVNWIIGALTDDVAFRRVVVGGGRSSWIDPSRLDPDATVVDPDHPTGNVGASAAWYWQHLHGVPPQAVVAAPSLPPSRWSSRLLLLGFAQSRAL